ncbi:TrmH family RNA methyltransferase [candidate division WWE3 bacterium]|uniref:TrmH family RNA methyltransferase n=1 Tax=candidate division WWE3 bacterium TaxID=2053526 RepID=A0A955RP35_UNCKA|nr:TrmH family RNA methyltransferase [candidate division WWE3 bacterium]
MPKKYKKKLDYSFTQGVYPTIELLTHKPEAVQQVFIHPNSTKNSGIDKIKHLCRKNRIRLEQTVQIFNRLKSPQNTYAIAFFDKYTESLSATEDHVLLMQPSDMGNIGTTIRTMLGFGCNQLAIIRPAVDVFHPKAVRASMGALFQIQVQYFESFREYREQFQDHHLYFYTLEDGNDSESAKMQTPATYVFGNEGEGIPHMYLEEGTAVQIPFETQKIDSLNLSVAIGIALHQRYIQKTS